MKYEVINAYYFRHLNRIGGIESHLRYLAKKYAKKYELVVFYQTADKMQLDNLRQYVRCVQLTQTDFVKCKRLFCCFNREILNQCSAEKKYLVLHGDYKNMIERGQLSESNLPVDKRIDEYLGVSQLVCDSWEEITGIKAKNVFEPVVIKKTKPLLFVSATRLTPEKGWNRMVKLAETMDSAGINYLWYVFTNSKKDGTRNMVLLPPRDDITDKVGGFDAYIQLSDNEGFCLSIVEALTQGVPVIATDLPVLKEIGANESNSIILPFDMEEIPIEKIRSVGEMEFSYNPPKDKWASVLDKTPGDDSLIEVMATEWYAMKNLFDVQLQKIPKKGDRFFVTKGRYEDLVNFGEKNRCTLVVKV